MQSISEIEELIKLISKLPGLGPRSAKRIVLKMINNREEIIRPMAKNLAEVYKNISRCKTCGSLKSNSRGCNNCENINQKYSKICVVENINVKISKLAQGLPVGGEIESLDDGTLIYAFKNRNSFTKD